jgi:TRAP-type C4-dicarboxylate transport system permease small subunit
MLGKTILLDLGAAAVKSVPGGNTLETDVTKIINNVILILGTVCVVAILIGGIYYITSSGDASKVEKGKKTILYAAIGLAICALSFAIVNWAIGAISGSSGTNEEDKNTDSAKQAYIESQLTISYNKTDDKV